MLDLFISKLCYPDLIIQNNYGTTALINLCENNLLTYKILDLFISKLNPEDLYSQDIDCKFTLNYLMENESIDTKIDYYKLFINQTILKDEFIDIIGFKEYTKYKIAIDDYFEIVNNEYTLK